MAEPVLWSDDGTARSARFGDVYRARASGLAQACTVFLHGCGLPEGWRGRARFTVLETGFGLGLNFLATWAAWRRDPRRCGCLHYVAVEAYPVAAGDIQRSAQALRPATPDEPDGAAELCELAAQLALAWPEPMAGGLQHLALAEGQVRLTLAVAPVGAALDSLPSCGADALYLDGFSPARNPDMWSPATLAAAARHCRPGCRAASYTVAGSVRQALQRVGFEVRKCPGLPPKWHRLEARLRG